MLPKPKVDRRYLFHPSAQTIFLLQWEFYYVYKTLTSMGVVGPGKVRESGLMCDCDSGRNSYCTSDLRCVHTYPLSLYSLQSGVAFGVGKEPLPSAFAALGAHVLGTDMPPEGKQASGWAEGNQYAAGKEALFKSELISHAEFEKLVSFQHVDMNK